MIQLSKLCYFASFTAERRLP